MTSCDLYIYQILALSGLEWSTVCLMYMTRKVTGSLWGYWRVYRTHNRQHMRFVYPHFWVITNGHAQSTIRFNTVYSSYIINRRKFIELTKFPVIMKSLFRASKETLTWRHQWWYSFNLSKCADVVFRKWCRHSWWYHFGYNLWMPTFLIVDQYFDVTVIPSWKK